MKSLYAVIFGLFVFAANAQNAEKHYAVKPGQNYNHNYNPSYNHNHHNHHNHYAPVRPAYPVHQHRHYQPYYYQPAPVYRNDWVAPLVGGIILGAVINESVDRYNERYCEWRIVNRYDDGTLVRKQVCYYDR